MLTPQTVAAADPLPVFYTCSFSCEDVVLQVTVNGFPLYSLPSSGNSGSQTSLIAQFFRKGTNEVLIQATPQNGADGNPKSSHIFVATGTGMSLSPP